MPEFEVAMNGAGPYYLRVVYQVDPTSGGNQVSATAQWRRNAWGSSSYDSAATYTLDIGGVVKSGTRSVNGAAGGAISPQWIESSSVFFVSSISATYMTVTLNTGTSDIGSGAINTLTVPISTATVPSFTPNPATAGAALTVNLPRQNSAYTHDLIYAFGALASQPMATGAGTSYSWTPPLSLLNQIPNATSGQLQIGATTKNGSATVGYQQVNGTLVAGPGIVPTISSVTFADQNSAVASAVGLPVAGLSRLKLTVNAAGVYSSTITAREATLDGTTVASGGEVAANVAGARPVTAKATDSRGRQATWSGSVTVLPYTAPAPSAYQVRRASAAGVLQDDGTYLRVDLTASISSLMNGTERNQLTIRAFTRPSSGGVWTPRNVITPGGTTYNSWFLISGGGIFTTTSSYEVRVQIEDRFATHAADAPVATAAVTVDLFGNKVGLGKIWEQGAVDVGPGGIFDDGQLVINSGDLASDSAPGIVELATQAEVDAGTVTDRAVTPKTVRDAIYSPHAEAAGSVAVAATGLTAVTFPAGRFTVAPVVTATVVGNANVSVPFVGTPSATGFDVRVYTVAGGQIAGTVQWTATQMRSSSAAG